LRFDGVGADIPVRSNSRKPSWQRIASRSGQHIAKIKNRNSKISNQMRDLKLTVRKITKNSGVISAVLLTIALCFGVTLLICAVAKSVLLRHFPFPTPDQLQTMFDPRSRPIFDLRFAICDFCQELGGQIRQREELSGTAADRNVRARMPSNRNSQI
jgi:hypothetical protein